MNSHNHFRERLCDNAPSIGAVGFQAIGGLVLVQTSTNIAEATSNLDRLIQSDPPLLLSVILQCDRTVPTRTESCCQNSWRIRFLSPTQTRLKDGHKRRVHNFRRGILHHIKVVDDRCIPKIGVESDHTIFDSFLGFRAELGLTQTRIPETDG
jgi:hypothetical protein